MPELPEVEVTRRQVEPLLVGRRVVEVRTTAPSYFFITDPERLRLGLEGRSIEGLCRHGKYLLAGLDGGGRLLLHLGMTGQLFAAGASSFRFLSASVRSTLDPDSQPAFEPDLHTHLQLIFDDGGPELYFRDVRKFGKVQLLAAGESSERIERLGVDTLAAVGEDLFRASRKRRVASKSLLLDQSVLAGVGNIYADEALFLAGVHPRRPAGKLGRKDCDLLVAGLQRVMRRSIETGGSSISDYLHPDGSGGGYQDERLAYGREGEPCTACGEPIERIVLGQRSTHFCPRCQRR